MKVIPIMKCKDMKESLSFYTNVLDFEIKYPDSTVDDPVVTIINDEAEIELSTMSGDSLFGCALNVRVDDVDEQFKKYVKRGLDVSGLGGVHGGPLDQTWGMREFYVNDPNGNTLRFGKPIDE
jgi:catechol 2,3-dioxygenase-like lactoylglutathione lyase family enzyme